MSAYKFRRRKNFIKALLETQSAVSIEMTIEVQFEHPIQMEYLRQLLSWFSFNLWKSFLKALKLSTTDVINVSYWVLRDDEQKQNWPIQSKLRYNLHSIEGAKKTKKIDSSGKDDPA